MIMPAVSAHHWRVPLRFVVALMPLSRFSRTSSPSAEMTRSSIEGGWDWAARVDSNRRVRRESHRRRMFVLRALFSSTSGYMREEGTKIIRLAHL